MIGIRQHRIITRYNNIFDVQKLLLKLFLIFVLSKFRNRSQIPNSKDRVLLICEIQNSWTGMYNKICDWGMLVLINGACMCLKNRSRSTGFLDLFYGKSEVSVKTLLIFFFIVAKFHVKTVVKMVDILLSFFWHQKWNWLMVAWIPSGKAACRQFHFFCIPNVAVS